LGDGALAEAPGFKAVLKKLFLLGTKFFWSLREWWRGLF